MFTKEVKEVADTVSMALANGQPEEAGNVATQEVNHALFSTGVDEAMADKVDNFITPLSIIEITLLTNLICRKTILYTVAKLVRQTEATWDDIVFDDKVVINISRIVAPILIHISIPIAFPEHADSALLDLLRRFYMIYTPTVLLRFVSALFMTVYLIYSVRGQYKDKPLEGFLQTAQVILFFIGAIIIISILIRQSPVVLLTGLGASAAVPTLVLKDSIVGLVSGIRPSANNMLKVGGWITVLGYDADGTAIEVTLDTMETRNFDNIITTVPPHLLTSDSFQNWQGIQEPGGCCTKRSINIDITSVHFCTSEMLAKYRRIQLLEDYVDEAERVAEKYSKEYHIDNPVLVNERRQTNSGVFRVYLTNYLKNLPTVNQDLIYMIRQPQPTEVDIPLELYFFSANKAWVAYEGIQVGVFDHVLAIIPEFDLRAFQNPSGVDLRRIEVKIEN